MSELYDRLKQARKDLEMMGQLCSASTSDAATRIYEARRAEFVKKLVAVEAEYKAQGLKIPTA